MNCDKCQATFGSRDYLAMHMLDHVRRESEAGELYAKASGAGGVSAAVVLSTAALAATEAAALFSRSGAGSYVAASVGTLPDRDALAMRLLCRVYRSGDVAAAAAAAAAAGSGGSLARSGGETRSSPTALPLPPNRNIDGDDAEDGHLRVADEEDKPLVAYDAHGTPRERAGTATDRQARPPAQDAADDDSDCTMSGGGSARGNAGRAVDLTMPAHRLERSAAATEAVARCGDGTAATSASDRRSVRIVAPHGLAAAAASAAAAAPAAAWPADGSLRSADKASFGRFRYSPYAGAASAAVAATAAYRWHFQSLAAAARLRAAAAATITSRAAVAAASAPSLPREQRLVKVEPPQPQQHQQQRELQPLVACRAGGVAELPPTSPAAEAEAAAAALATRPALPAAAASSSSPPSHASLPAPSLWLGGAFTCRYCRISFADRTMYLLHAGLHGQENPWQCNICSATCVDALDFAIHSLHR